MPSKAGFFELGAHSTTTDCRIVWVACPPEASNQVPQKFKWMCNRQEGFLLCRTSPSSQACDDADTTFGWSTPSDISNVEEKGPWWLTIISKVPSGARCSFRNVFLMIVNHQGPFSSTWECIEVASCPATSSSTPLQRLQRHHPLLIVKRSNFSGKWVGSTCLCFLDHSSHGS